MTAFRRGRLIRRLLAGAVLMASAFFAPFTGSALARPAAASSTLRIWYGSDDPTEQTWASGLAKQFAASALLVHGLIPARTVDGDSVRTTAPFQHDFFTSLAAAKKGIYLDALLIPNFPATMEAQLQQRFAGKESPAALTETLQAAYASHGRTAQFADTDGEF